jgi:hypothetical protein
MSVSIIQFNQITGFVASSCWNASLAEGATITTAEAAAVLAAWNANILVSGSAALDLQAAAAQTLDQLAARWTLGDPNIKAACSAYGNALLTTFPDQNEGGRPIANWATLIVGLASTFT